LKTASNGLEFKVLSPSSPTQTVCRPNTYF